MEPEQPWKRPRLIRDLGVLSFLNTGFFMLLYGLMLISAPVVQRMPYADLEASMLPQLKAWSGEGGDDVAIEMLHLLHESGVALMGLLFLRTAARLVGVLGLWNGRHWGFSVYASAQLAGIFLPFVVLPWKFLSLGGPLLAMGMTALYGTQRKYLR